MMRSTIRNCIFQSTRPALAGLSDAELVKRAMQAAAPTAPTTDAAKLSDSELVKKALQAAANPKSAPAEKLSNKELARLALAAATTSKAVVPPKVAPPTKGAAPAVKVAPTPKKPSQDEEIVRKALAALPSTAPVSDEELARQALLAAPVSTASYDEMTAGRGQSVKHAEPLAPFAQYLHHQFAKLLQQTKGTPAAIAETPIPQWGEVAYKSLFVRDAVTNLPQALYNAKAKDFGVTGRELQAMHDISNKALLLTVDCSSLGSYDAKHDALVSPTEQLALRLVAASTPATASPSGVSVAELRQRLKANNTHRGARSSAYSLAQEAAQRKRDFLTVADVINSLVPSAATLAAGSMVVVHVANVESYYKDIAAAHDGDKALAANLTTRLLLALFEARATLAANSVSLIPVISGVSSSRWIKQTGLQHATQFFPELEAQVVASQSTVSTPQRRALADQLLATAQPAVIAAATPASSTTKTADPINNINASKKASSNTRRFRVNKKKLAAATTSLVVTSAAIRGAAKPSTAPAAKPSTAAKPVELTNDNLVALHKSFKARKDASRRAALSDEDLALAALTFSASMENPDARITAEDFVAKVEGKPSTAVVAVKAEVAKEDAPSVKARK